MDRFVRDIRLSRRALTRSPGFTAIAVVTLAIGIGSTAVMLTAANAAFRQPLPFAGPDPLARVWQVSPRSNRIALALPVWRDLQSGLTSFASVAATLGAGSVNITNGADAERAVRGMVSRSFFSTLGAVPALGREFSADEATPNGPLAVVISDALWERFFARDGDILSKTISIEGVPHPIVGVMPAGAAYPQGTDLWTTFERNGDYGGRTAHNFEVIARLARGTSVRQAQAELDTLTRAMLAQHADMAGEGYSMRLVDLREDLLGSSRSSLLLLLSAVACVLLIGCANVVNLLLARAVSRESQTTLRIALGATQADIVRLFVVESLMLACAGGVLGALLTVWTGELAGGLIPVTVVPAAALRPDPGVFAAILAVTLAVGLLCGLLPARHASRVHLRTAMAAGAPTVVGEPRMMRVLVSAEVAVGCLLLVGSGLLVRSLLNLEAIDPGFRPAGLVAAPFSLGSASDSPYAKAEARAQFFDRLLERVRVMPGMQAAGVTGSFPFTFSPNAGLQEDGAEPLDRAAAPSTHYRVIGGEYFQAMQVPLKAGRYFTDADRAGAPHVAIVNEFTARAFWKGESAVGRRVRMANMDGIAEYATVIGVVADMRHRGIASPAVSEIYFPYAQRPARTFSMTLVMRGDGEAAAYAAPLRAAVREVDPGVPAVVALVEERLAAQLAPARFRTGLLTAFGLVSLVLSACGIFGVVSYSVARRTREMGIRLALGAKPSAVRRLVLRRALMPVVVGLFVGANAALLASRLVAGLTFEVPTADPISFTAAVGTLFGAALLAASWPAYRATRVNPITALRVE